MGRKRVGDDEFVEPPTTTKKAKVLKKDMYNALLIVIDCGYSMGAKEDDGKTSFDMAREAADWIVSRKIFTHANDRISIITYGTDCFEEANRLSLRNVAEHEEILSKVKFDHLRFINNELTQSEDATSRVVDGLAVAVEFMRNETEGDPAVDGKSILLLTNGQNDMSQETAKELKHIGNAMNALGSNFVVIGIDEEKVETLEGKALIDLCDSVEGTSYSFSNATQALHNFTTPRVESRAVRKNWEIAPGVRLPLAMYTYTSAAKNPLKAVYIDDDGGQMARHSSFVPKQTDQQSQYVSHQDINDQEMNEQPEEVDKDNVVSGYLFGSSAVVIEKDDEDVYKNHNFNEGEERGCLKLIQFTHTRNILPSYFLGNNAFKVVPGWEKKTGERDRKLMVVTEALMAAMERDKSVAICRYAYSASSNLQIMALIPHRDPDTNLLYMTGLRLPFLNDWRAFSFTGINAKQFQPTEEQNLMIDNFIDVMDLDKHECTKFDSENVLNPHFQRQCAAMKNKALKSSHDDTEIEPSLFLQKSLVPDHEMLRNAEKIIAVMCGPTGFDLKAVEKQKRVQRLRDEVVSLDAKYDELMAAANAASEAMKMEDEGVRQVNLEGVKKEEPATQSMGTASIRVNAEEQQKQADLVQKKLGREFDIKVVIKGIETRLDMFHEEGDDNSDTDFWKAYYQMLALRRICLSCGKTAEFNRFLISLQTKEFAQSLRNMSYSHPDMVNLITNAEDLFSPYAVDDCLMFWTDGLEDKSAIERL